MMTGQPAGPENTTAPSKGLDRRWLVAGAVVVVVLALVFALTRGGDPTVAVPGGPAGTSTASSTAATSSSGTSSSSSPGTSGTTTSTSSSTSTASVPPSTTSAPTQPGSGAARPTQPPVSLTAPATPVPGVTATLASIEKVQGLSNLPGEIAGPSLRITVRYDNTTTAAVDLRGAVVNVYMGTARTPALGLTQPGAKPFPASVAAGQSAQGIFVFNVPTNQRSLVEVEVDLSNQGDVVLFRGPVS